LNRLDGIVPPKDWQAAWHAGARKIVRQEHRVWRAPEITGLCNVSVAFHPGVLDVGRDDLGRRRLGRHGVDVALGESAFDLADIGLCELVRVGAEGYHFMSGTTCGGRSLLRWLLLDQTGFYGRDLAVDELVCQEPLLVESFELSQVPLDR
jgi:hypothetical protein